jgi:hypothetical protein
MFIPYMGDFVDSSKFRSKIGQWHDDFKDKSIVCPSFGSSFYDPQEL